MLVTRRTLNRALAAGALVGLLPAMPGPGAAQAGKVPTDRVFDVLLKGKSIGRHAITFTPEGDGFWAVTDLNLKVKLAFLTLLDMSHQSRELWRGGELKSMTSVTDDDGEVFKVDADADGEGIRVQSESGSIVAPPMSRTSNSIWDITMMRQSEIIDAQNGGVIGLVAEAQGDDTIQVLGRQVTAARYRGVTPAAAAQLWYAEDQLVQVRLEVRGETVDYRLVA
jgi:hypothetical protein